jgi:peptidoglycan/xylan/chitin deacetylase (PgdA/CDA1 family)
MASLDLLEELRIPQEAAHEKLRWPAPAELAGLRPRWFEIEGIPVYARTVGETVGRDGDVVVLPFDPDEAVRNLRSEAYVHGGARAAARRVYYRVRPLLPRPLQLAARRAFTRVQGRATFPRWPLEPALHDLVDLVVGLLGEPQPASPWPDGCAWAFVLTHDVESAAGLANVRAVRALEEARGLRSSWNLVAERYDVPRSFVDELAAAGHEIGVHGLRHDGRDLSSPKRLPAMRAAAARWGAVGFRAPATQRCWERMPQLGFDYDSSYPDTDPYEPQPGGCCSWLPFLNEGLVELPITVPQDHTVFEILRRDDESLWVEKIEAVRARGGMALVLTHPDYLVPGSKALASYERLLDRYADDPTAWRALPRDVASWWRAR